MALEFQKRAKGRFIRVQRKRISRSEKMIEEFQAYLDPVIPSGGYNGSARRYWDFIYGGKTQRLERQLHHYGSCFGGNVQANNGIATFTILDSFRNRVFLALLGLWLTLDAGHFSSVDYDTKHKTVRLHLAPQSDGVTVARLHIEQRADVSGAHRFLLQVQWPGRMKA